MKESSSRNSSISKDCFAVILAGGKGSRFWPLSTPELPKQFLPLGKNGKTLLQETIDRVKKIFTEEQIVVVTTSAHEENVHRELGTSKVTVLLEPDGKNTAPSIAYASWWIFEKNPEAKIGVFPSDHFIENEDAWKNTVQTALLNAEDERILTVGIQPTSAHTGFGYIEIEKPKKQTFDQVYSVIQFTEKPNLQTAKRFFESGKHFFNSGMFFFRASKILSSFKVHQPAIFRLFEKWKALPPTERSFFLKQHFPSLDPISIDYGIMESEKNIQVVVGDFGWSDLGTWDAIFNVKQKGSKQKESEKKGNAQNVVEANANLIDTQNCLIHSTSEKPIVVIGAKDLVIVETETGLLVSSIHQTQKVKDATKKLVSK